MTQRIESKSADASTGIVIGIGASAGGLEAIHDLFDYMPVNTGFSFVVIQHLSPDYKSLMADLLSRHTQMVVCEAEHGMEVKPNCIYVIPSKKLMTIKKGQLILEEKLKSRMPNNAIDVFLDSLAKDLKSKAVAVILSGTGSDGSRGIGAIKKEGGIVIVQDPLTAGFDGMPNSAIDTGCSDLILPPEMIGEEIINYLHEIPMLRTFKILGEEDEASLREIIDHLNRSIQRDFSQYKRPTLLRRLIKRMSEVGINSLKEYSQYLQQHEEEPKILGKEFLINVTRFFRDKEAFEVLRTEAIPQIVENRKKNEAIKLWIVACSTGEEAYSVGILLMEYLELHQLTDTQFKVFATDIDADALETASRGIYPESISKDLTADRLERYFVREGNMFRVAADLRKHVVFANHDILKDPPFSHLDLITCRNMFIYVNPLLQQKILRKFHFALNLNAYLMMGPSENVDVLKDYLQEVNRKWKLYRCTIKTRVVENDTLMLPLEKTVYRPSKSSKVLSNNLAEIFKETVLASKKMASLFIDRDFNVKQAIGAYKTFLQFPEDSFNFNLMKMVSGDMAVALGVAIRKSIATDEMVMMNRVVIHDKEGINQVSITVKPYLKQQQFQQPFICVVVEDESPDEPIVTKVITDHTQDSAARITELEQELKDTRENLQAVIEEMETANEELQSSSEEMISTNEELQSTNEELQSLNEELHTVSVEHQLKIKELHDLNDDLNNYFNNSGVGHILVDKKLIIRKFSPAVTRMVNVINADIGRSIIHITSNIKEFDLVEAIRGVLETSVPFDREISIEGDRFYLMRIAPYIKRDKSADGAVINFTDISESKRLTGIIDGIFISSTNGITALKAIRDLENKIVDFEFLAANTAAEAFFETSRSIMPGKKLSRLFPDNIMRTLESYSQVVETGREVNFEFYHRKCGRWFSINGAKMMDGLVVTHSDITDVKMAARIIEQNYEDLQLATQQLKNSNAQLERSNLDLLQFASVASHDLKEPLRKIQAFGNILRAKINSRLAPDELNYFDRMINASGRMQALIEDVLALSKLSDSSMPKEKVNLTEIGKNILDDLEMMAKEKKAIIEMGELPVIPAVPWQMHQLFQNLISNALKFTKSNGEQPRIVINEQPISTEDETELKISAENFTCISVKDNGIGFEAEYSSKIFGIFQRLNGRQFEGTGIGLAIAKKIVENHGGHIRAKSSLDHGAQFLVYLPLYKNMISDNPATINAHLN